MCNMSCLVNHTSGILIFFFLLFYTDTDITREQWGTISTITRQIK